MEAVVFLVLLFSVLFLGLSPEKNLLLPSVLLHFHQHHQIGTGGKSCYAHILGGNIRRREKMECTMDEKLGAKIKTTQQPKCKQNEIYVSTCLLFKPYCYYFADIFHLISSLRQSVVFFASFSCLEFFFLL